MGRCETDIRALAISPDSKSIVAAENIGNGSNGAVIKIWDISMPNNRRIVVEGVSPLHSNLSQLTFSPDGGKIALVDYEKIYISDVKNQPVQSVTSCAWSLLLCAGADRRRAPCMWNGAVVQVLMCTTQDFRTKTK